MQPFESAKDFLVQLTQLGVREQFSALPPAYQRELYEWVAKSPAPAERVARMQKLQARLMQ